MDIGGAFDKTSFTRFNTALVRRDVNPLITRWVTFMLAKKVWTRKYPEQKFFKIGRGRGTPHRPIF